MSTPLAELGLVAAELAHELRNVLAVIQQSAHAAALRPDDAPRMLERVTRNAELGQRLVDDVLELARERPLRLEIAPLHDRVLAARGTLLGDADFVDEGLETLLSTDPVLFPRVLHVLYANAVAVARGGRARIVTRAEATADGVVVEVEDDGPGIAAGLQDRLFEPFASGRKGGTGLGLALARRIVEAHSGRLTLQSERPSTTFRIALPAHT